MYYIEAPNNVIENIVHVSWPKIFLAGSITNAKDWQKPLVEKLENSNCIIYNPRRASFDVNDKTQSEVQIKWEFVNLRNANIVVFYFSEETLAPITLFELGSRLEAMGVRGKYQKIHIYCESNYPRKEDVYIQTQLIIDTMNINSPLNMNLQVFLHDQYDNFVKGLKNSIDEHNLYECK